MDTFGRSGLSLSGNESVRLVSLYKNCRFPFDPYSKVACCSFSGPIAISTLKDTTSEKYFIVKIYTANGEQLSEFEFTGLYQMFWTLSQKLVLLSKNGRVSIYTAKGKAVGAPFYMDQQTETQSICSAKIFYPNQSNMKYSTTGLACLKESGQFFAVNNVETAHLWRITDVAYRNAIPTVWSMLPSDDIPLLAWWTAKDGFKMAGQGKSTTTRVADWMRTKGDYTEMVPSIDMKSVCLMHDSGTIQIVKLDFSTELYSFDLTTVNLNRNSARILWSKKDQIMLRASQNKIMCLARNSEPTEFTFYSEIHTCPEIDGLHVFDKATADTILPVSSSIRNTLSLMSKESSATLYEALGKYKARDPMANDYVIQIGDNLPKAIKDCWAAALEARLPDEESNLFSAAVFGQSLQKTSKISDRIDFAQHCKHLRILHFLHKRGIPMSYAQFEIIEIDGIIDRLVEMGLYAAADVVAQQANPSARKRIVAHWALDAIVNASVGLTDEVELGDKIIARFTEQKNASFAATAEVAHKYKLDALASRLLDLEEDVVQQVTTLLKLKQLKKALQKSAKSKNPDLLFMVIRQLKLSQQNKDFEMTILKEIPHAFEMYKNMAQEENSKHLIALYQQSDDFRRQVIHHITSLSRVSLFDVAEIGKTISNAVEALDAANAPQLASLMKQHKILVLNNSKLEEECGVSLIDKTLRETVMWAAVNNPSLVDSLRKQYKLNEKQCYKWVVDALAEAQKWERLENFEREYKSPYSSLALIKILMKHEQKDRALKLLNKVPPADQVEAYEIVRELKKAAEIAFERKDMKSLMQLSFRYPVNSKEYEIVSSFMDRARNG